MRLQVTRQKRRGKRVWVLDWFDRDGKRHQPQFPTREAAEDEADRIRDALKAQPTSGSDLPADITWNQLFARVMATREDLKLRTREDYDAINRLHLAPAFGATAVRDLTRFRLQQHLQQKRRTHAENSVRLMWATLHVVLAQAVEFGLLAGNPAGGLAKKLKLVVKGNARQQAVGRKAMTRAQRDAFLAAAEKHAPWWAPIWTVQVLTGLRPGEVYALEERDLDLDAQAFTVSR
jgi:integrase